MGSMGQQEAAPVENDENREPGRDKRSRDRYGRERSPRGERRERPAPEAQQALDGFSPPHEVAVAPVLMPVAAHGEPLVTTAAAEPVSAQPIAEVVHVSPAPAVAAAAIAPATGLPKVQPFILPIESLLEVAQNSGLAWINSDSTKVAAAQAAIAAEPKPVHVPRERTALIELDNRPLVLVETKRDLRNLTLPFENQVTQTP